MRCARDAGPRCLPVADPLRLTLAWLCALLLIWAGASRVPAKPVTFSAIGDVPYGTDEIDDLEQHVLDHNRYSPASFLIHLGDINAGSETCREDRYRTVADILKLSEVPVFIVPGDNEWVDCSDPDQAWAWWEEHLLGLEQSFCATPPVESQGARPENFAFLIDGVLFIGLNYVSGTPSSVARAAADWVEAQFAAHGSARAAVLMAQKEPSGDLFDAVKSNGRSFGRPVLYIHGNGHSWKYDTGFFGESNMLRVQVDRGTRSNPPVQVTFTDAGDFELERDPWPPGTPTIDRPACVDQPLLSIDDLFVLEGDDAVFTVTLLGADGSSVSVAYETQDDSARAGEDYEARSGSLSFNGSTTQRTLTVRGLQDTDPEPAEAFFVDLLNASGAAIEKARGAAVILDDDEAPAQQFTLALTTQGAGSVERDPAGPTHADGTVVTLTAFPDPGHVFTGWSGALGGSANPATLLMDSDKSVTATFEPVSASQHVLSVIIDGGGSVALEPPGGVYDAGSVVTLTALPDAGQGFAGWSGDLGGATNPTTLGMDADRRVTASFVPVTPGGDVALREVQTGGASSSSTVATSAPVTAASGDLYLAAIAFKPDVPVSSVAGLGLAWTPVRQQCAGRGQTGVALYQARGNPAADGRVTATLAEAPSSAVIAVARYANVAPSDAVGSAASANSNGLSGACDGGTDGAAYAFDLTTTAPDSLVFVAAAMRSKDHQPGAGYTERAEIFQGSGGSVASASLADRPRAAPGNVVVNGGFSSETDWAVLAVEVRAGEPPSDPVTLTLLPTSGGSVDLDPPGGSYEAGTVVSVTAVPEAGHLFTGWTGDLAGSDNPETLVVDADKTVGAGFARPVLALDVGPGGSVDLDPPGGTYDAGSVVVLSARPEPGFAFSGWGGDLSGLANPASLVMDSVQKNVSASFGPEYTVSLSPTTGGSIGLEPPGGVYGEGSVVTLSASPDPGFAFAAWSGDLSGSANPASLRVDGDKTVGASFVAQHPLEVSVQGSGSVSLQPAGGLYAPGTVVTLTANPDAGAGFDGWGGDLGGSQNPTTLVMDAPKSVTAHFRSTFSLSLQTKGKGSVVLDPPGGVYADGTRVTLTAIPEASFEFRGWSGDLSGEANPEVLTLDGDKSVSANFRKSRK